MASRKTHEARREARESERIRLEGVRRRNVIVLTVSLFLLLGGVVDSQALYALGLLPMDGTALAFVTVILCAGLGTVAFRSWRAYRAAGEALARL